MPAPPSVTISTPPLLTTVTAAAGSGPDPDHACRRARAPAGEGLLPEETFINSKVFVDQKAGLLATPARSGAQKT
jgi:hypothetical protein